MGSEEQSGGRECEERKGESGEIGGLKLKLFFEIMGIFGELLSAILLKEGKNYA